MPQKFRDDIHFQQKELERSENTKIRKEMAQIPEVVKVTNPNKSEDQVTWTDISKLHDHYRNIVSERQKKREK